MKKKSALAFGILLVFLVFSTHQSTAQAIQGGLKETSQARLVESYGKLPLRFEANEGQTDKKVKFLSRGQGYSLFLTPNEAVLALRKPGTGDAKISKQAVIPGKAAGRDPESVITQAKNNWMPASAGMASEAANAGGDDDPPQTGAVLRLRFLNTEATTTITGLDELPGTVNYVKGRDPEQWRTGIPTYGKVKYERIYPGVAFSTGTPSSWNMTSWSPPEQTPAPSGSASRAQTSSTSTPKAT